MKKTIATLMLACAGQMFAGGFWLQLGNPDANPVANKMGAVVTIKAVGCHDPAAGFGDSQPIAIGVQNDRMIVGASRDGPRNQRRSPTIVNVIFYPSLMWDGRFFAPSRDPFDNSQGFSFPPPEGRRKFVCGTPAAVWFVSLSHHTIRKPLAKTDAFEGKLHFARFV